MARLSDTPQNVVRRLRTAMNKPTASGLTAAARFAASRYWREVTRKTHSTFPDGPFDPEESSQPGEFPARRTGQGADNIYYENATEDDLRAAFGVLGEDEGFGPYGPNSHVGGMHLIWLMQHGRLGPDEIVRRYLPGVVGAFKEGAIELTNDQGGPAKE